jgi:CTP:molybdopterin cytidylyltransferase MocA
VIVGVVLAAGAGTRIGHAKALLRAGSLDESFVQCACRVLREGGVKDLLVVASPDLIDAVRGLLDQGVGLLVNDFPARGQLSSLQVALGALSDDTRAIVMLPVDVPLVSAETVRALIARWEQTASPVVRPVSGARHGHPVVFDRVVFAELAAAPLSEGAKPVVRRHVSADGDLHTGDAGAFRDIDTVEDYVAAFGRLPATVRVR